MRHEPARSSRRAGPSGPAMPPPMAGTLEAFVGRYRGGCRCAGPASDSRRVARRFAGQRCPGLPMGRKCPPVPGTPDERRHPCFQGRGARRGRRRSSFRGSAVSHSLVLDAVRLARDSSALTGVGPGPSGSRSFRRPEARQRPASRACGARRRRGRRTSWRGAGATARTSVCHTSLFPIAR